MKIPRYYWTVFCQLQGPKMFIRVSTFESQKIRFWLSFVLIPKIWRYPGLLMNMSTYFYHASSIYCQMKFKKPNIWFAHSRKLMFSFLICQGETGKSALPKECRQVEGTEIQTQIDYHFYRELHHCFVFVSCTSWFRANFSDSFPKLKSLSYGTKEIPINWCFPKCVLWITSPLSCAWSPALVISF